MKRVGIILLIAFLVSSISPLLAEGEVPGNKFTISGHVRDANNGEELIGATIYVEELKAGGITNLYGFYSISLEPGTYNLTYSYVGFKPVSKTIKLDKDKTVNIELKTSDQEIEEVVVTGEKENINVVRNEMIVVKMKMQNIKKIPAFMGEVDVIKAIQRLPGVQAASEGSSGFSGRGGAADQNLILLDEATVYNASHLMGFFSVFNNDAIKDVKLYKGDIPAAFGGRLSSLLDIRMKDGNLKRISGSGGIGTISSRLTLEGPLVKDQTSFILSGRRTYADLFLPFAGREEIRDNKLYFYDFNAKINHKINENNRVFVSGYFGEDIFKNQFAKMKFGNKTATARWNHLFSKKLFSNFTLIYSQYDYMLGSAPGEANSFTWKSGLHDYDGKIDFNYYLNPDNTIKFGVSVMRHKIAPALAKAEGDESLFADEYKLQEDHSLENGVYVSNEQKINSLFTIKYGLRLSTFHNIGSHDVFSYLPENDYQPSDSTHYGRDEIYNSYYGLEPRLGMVYQLTEFSSVKASYSRTKQFIQLAQNSAAGTPLNVWFPASPNVKPQISDQVAVGYFRNFLDNKLETSVETYYKKMQNTIDFRDHAQLWLNKHMEGELRFGESYSYGVELLTKLVKGRLTGWISYTYSRSLRQIKGVYDGKEYPSFYDKPHDVSVVMNYELSNRISIGGNWVYSTGVPATFPVGRGEYQNQNIPVYSGRNQQRYPDYHRMDLSVTIRGKENRKKPWEGEWNFSIYNVYMRKNVWAINFVQDEQNPNKMNAEMTYLFSIVPAITYNFKF